MYKKVSSLLMKTALILFFMLYYGLCFSQTIKVGINANQVIFDDKNHKAFVIVNTKDNSYSNNLIQINPFTGGVERSLKLNDNPYDMKFTPDCKHIYISYATLTRIDKVNVEEFKIVESINLGAYNAIDFVVSPINENYLFVVLGEANNPRKTVMYKNGVIQSKTIDDFRISISALSIKSDGKWIYGHNGVSTGCQGYLIEVLDDGIKRDSIEWKYMIGSFGKIKNKNGLIYGSGGDVVDPFSKNMPITVAQMPVLNLTRFNTAFEYSKIHNSYVFAHQTDYHPYISFFHGSYYNYLGSVKLEVSTDYIYDVDVIDEKHFILISLEPENDYKKVLLLHTIE